MTFWKFIMKIKKILPQFLDILSEDKYSVEILKNITGPLATKDLEVIENLLREGIETKKYK